MAAPICLADLCPVFGCRSSESRAVDDRKAKEQSLELSDHFQHVLSASVLDRHERCTPEKLQYVQMVCEDLATRCFDSLPSGGRAGGKGMSAGEKFRNKVCVNLRCQRGLLEGGIRPEVQIVSNSFFYRIIRLLVVVIILIIACFQGDSSQTYLHVLPHCSSLTGWPHSDSVGSWGTFVDVSFVFTSQKRPSCRLFSTSTLRRGRWIVAASEAIAVACCLVSQEQVEWRAKGLPGTCSSFLPHKDCQSN